MTIFFRLCLLLACFLGGFPALAARSVEVKSARLWAGPDSTRVVFDLTGSATHTLANLHNPERVVLHVGNAHVVTGRLAWPKPSGVVKQLQVANQPAGGIQVIVELTKPSHATSFLASPNARYGYRLVLDLGGAAGVSSGAVTVNTVAPNARVPVAAKHAPRDARDLIVAIDAGHGGDDPGAIGKNGTREKDVVLAIARELANKIDAEPGMRAVLTRDGDYFVPLRDRMRRARAKQADLFVSIHADSVLDRSIDGSSVYILSQHGASNEASRWLAERENASDLIGGVSLDDKDGVLASVLLDLSQSAAMSASQVAAERVLHSLIQAGEIRKHQVQQAGFMVLKSPDIPSMLVETAYISNPDEERRLRTPSHQALLAAAIHHGIRDYFYANPPSGTRVAQIAAGSSRPVLATAGGDDGN